MSRRLEPSVLFTLISPTTLVLAVAVGALVGALTGAWLPAVVAGLVVAAGRVVLSQAITRRTGSLDARIDPFALREPWRFFVRDALSAQRRLNEALGAAEPGPLRVRLEEIEGRLSHAVAVTWDVARRGQQLTDARNRINVAKLDRTLAATEPADPRHAAARAQKESHARLRAREDDTRARLEIIDARLEETITRVGELATRTGGAIEIDRLGEQVDGMVDELDTLRIALDEVGNDT